jgi:hypothetical protein
MEGDPVVRSARLPVQGSGPQDQVIVIGQGVRVAGEDVLADFPDPPGDRGGCRGYPWVRPAVEGDSRRFP